MILSISFTSPIATHPDSFYLRTSKLMDAARNPLTPVQDLIRLAGNADDDVRFLVAQNSGTPAPLLKRLSRDKIPLVRQAVAKNTNTRMDILMNLTCDPIPHVSESAKNNPKFKNRG